MPKQIGNMPAIGAMNNMSYYKTKDGIMVKMKSVIPKSKFKTKKFALVRKNNAEFGLAGKAGQTLRGAVKTIIGNCQDTRMTSRLTTLILDTARKTDTTSPHGERSLAKGDLQKLRNFDFNVNAILAHALPVKYSSSIDRATGIMRINIDAFDPTLTLTIPDSAAYFRLVSAGSEVDFLNKSSNTEAADSGFLPVSDPVAALSFEHHLAPASTLPLFLFLGIQYFQEINGVKEIVGTETANALGIIEVN